MQNNSKQLAHKLVASLAPNEEPLFEGMWTDYQQNQSLDEADNSDREHGLGGVEEISYLSTIIIPLVVAISSKLVTNTADAVFNYIKDKIIGPKKQEKRKMTDEDIRALAVEISKQLGK
jgi:hypothetical protein